MAETINKMRSTLRKTKVLLGNLSFDEFINRLLNISVPKFEQEFVDYQKPVRSTIERDPDNDRVFPLETVMLGSGREVDNEYKEKTILHTGPYADELAYRMHALAVVYGTDIYFRNRAYQPETEEGRKIIAHELKHVEQYNEKLITPNADREELEREAEQAETQAEYDPDPYELYPVGNKVFYLRRSQIEEIDEIAADGVERWLEEQKYIRSEKEYLELLSDYAELLDEKI